MTARVMAEGRARWEAGTVRHLRRRVDQRWSLDDCKAALEASHDYYDVDAAERWLEEQAR